MKRFIIVLFLALLSGALCRADAVVIVQSDGKRVPVVTVAGATDVKVQASGSVQVVVTDPPAAPVPVPEPIPAPEKVPAKPDVKSAAPHTKAIAPPKTMPKVYDDSAQRAVLRAMFAKKSK